MDRRQYQYCEGDLGIACPKKQTSDGWPHEQKEPFGTRNEKEKETAARAVARQDEAEFAHAGGEKNRADDQNDCRYDLERLHHGKSSRPNTANATAKCCRAPREFALT